MPFSFRLRALPTWEHCGLCGLKMVYILCREAHGQLGKKEFAGERLTRFVFLCSVIAVGECFEELQTRAHAHLCVAKRKQLLQHLVVLLRCIRCFVDTVGVPFWCRSISARGLMSCW